MLLTDTVVHRHSKISIKKNPDHPRTFDIVGPNALSEILY